MISYFYTKTYVITYNEITHMTSLVIEERNQLSLRFVDNVWFVHTHCDDLDFHFQIHYHLYFGFQRKKISFVLLCITYDKIILTFLSSIFSLKCFLLPCCLFYSFLLFIYCHQSFSSFL